MAAVKFPKDAEGNLTGRVVIELTPGEIAIVKQAHDGQLVKDPDSGAVIGGQVRAKKTAFEQLMSLAQNALSEAAQRGSQDSTKIDARIAELQAERDKVGTPDFGTV